MISNDQTTTMDSEKASELKLEDQTEQGDSPDERSFDPAWDAKLQRRAVRKMDILIMPLVVLLYLFCSLDKSNLGNAKTLGMIKDIGGDPTGSRYALLNAFYFIAYAPLMIPLSLLAKRTKVCKVMASAGIFWGTAATCFAAVNSFPGAFACRFFVGLGEAGFAPLVPLYLARWYTKKDLAVRVAFWLCAAPMGGFCNGIIAYGVSFIKSHLEPWRVLFLIEGLATIAIATAAMIVLPEDIQSARWFTADEKAFLLYRREMEMSHETNKINWKHARGSLYRWQSVLPCFMYASQFITGAALAAFLPTLTSEIGFKGATAQIATLAPYGSAAVMMLIVSKISDRCRNRGWFVQLGFVFMLTGFGIYLGADASNHAARFAALIFAEIGHYIATPLILTWSASNCGSESRRAVNIPLIYTLAATVSVSSGYLFPASQAPKYTKGSTASVALSAGGCLLTFLYQYLLYNENRKRDERDGKPSPDLRPETVLYADDAPGFRYQL